MAGTSLDFRDRAAIFASLEATVFDVLVIGAGITGAGVARDASMRGLSVAVVDANDIAAGTSSRSSKLIHGGMRYLASGQIGVVREAARERKILRRIAPHLAQTTKMVFPVKSRRAQLKMKVAMVAYERLGEVDAAERHEVWDAARLAEEEPEIRAGDFLGAVVYPEYVTDDARLTLANVRSAAEHGAIVATYARVNEIVVEEGRASGAIVHATLGEDGLGARIRARTVVNASGPWLDAVRMLEDGHSAAKLQLTKGIHVAFERGSLPIHGTIVMATPDRRSIFVVPHGRFVYFGTTDTFYPEAAYWPEITEDDIEYLLRCGRETFRSKRLTHDDIVSVWSGIRPLLAQEGKKPNEISRHNEILCGPHGVLSIAGGKLTSYRSMAQRIVNRCLEQMGRERTLSHTAEEPLPGWTAGVELQSVKDALGPITEDADEAERLVGLYGCEAAEVVALESGPAAEARWAVMHEGALTLEDYWARRSARAHFDDDGGMASLDAAANVMGKLLDWPEAERAAQIASCRAIRRSEMQAVCGEASTVG